MHSINITNWFIWRQIVTIISFIILLLPSFSLADDPLAPDMRAYLIPFSLSNSQLTPHEDFSMGVDIVNEGSIGSDTTTLQCYLSLNSMISTFDTKIGGEFPVSSLDPSDFESLYPSLTAPITEGTYYVGACVVPVPDELATANNCSESFQITVDGDPDLTVISPSVSNASLVTNQEYNITVTVKNIGTVPSTETSIRFFLSTNSTIELSDERLSADTYYAVSALEPGMIDQITTLQLYAPLVKGDYYVGACVNTTGGEVNFDNNCSSGVLINVDYIRPDLTINYIGATIDPYPLTTGQSFIIRATVVNIGTQMSNSTNLRYYLSSNSIISTSDTELATNTLQSITPNSGSFEVATVLAPVTPLSYWVGACVDAVNNEINTSNQCSTGYLINVTKGAFPWTMFLSAIMGGQ